MSFMRYKVSIEPRLDVSLLNFRKKISSVLNDPRSWPITFIDVSNTNHISDFQIILARDSTIKNICNFTFLSCADSITNIIYINVNRWKYGAVKSKLNLNDYRTYVINHEVGHILGLGHEKPIKNKKAPIMNQHTLGIGDAIPNMWPLKYERSKIL